MADIIKLKRGKSEAWVRKNPVLFAGEVGVELDTHQMKVGDGATAWKDLPYVGATAVVNKNEYSSSPAVVDGVPYQSIDVAFAQAPSGSTIRLNNTYSNSVEITKELTVDLNGNDMINNEITPIAVGMNGKLTVKGQGTIECNKNGKPALINNGDTTVANGKFQRTIDVQGNGYYTAVNHNNMTINGGMFMSGGSFSSMIQNGYWDYTSTDPAQGYVAGVNAEMPIMTINDGAFAGGLYAIKNDDNAVLNINGGAFYNTILANGKSMTITDGYFENNKPSPGEYNLYLRKLSEDINPQDTYISGGTFITAQDKNFKVEGNPHIEISGGRFNRELDPSYLAPGYKQVLINGFYTVQKEE